MKSINLLKTKWSFVVMSVVTILFLMAIVPTTNHKVFAAEDKTAARTINVNGDGEVSVTPDIAYVSLGVTTENSSVDEAQKSNSATMNNVIAAVKKAGVAGEDMKTSSYSISPKYSYDDKTGKSTIVGYTVTSNLSIAIKKINSVGSIIDTAISNGANNSNGVTFGVSDYAKYYNMALVNAISNAKAKAQVVAGCIDVKISTPTKITENSNGVPVDYPIMYDLAAKNSSAGQGMTLEVGTYKVKANVSLVYEY